MNRITYTNVVAYVFGFQIKTPRLCTVFLVFASDDYGHICKGSKHSVVKKVISMCSNYVSKQV